MRRLLSHHLLGAGALLVVAGVLIVVLYVYVLDHRSPSLSPPSLLSLSSLSSLSLSSSSLPPPLSIVVAHEEEEEEEEDDEARLDLHGSKETLYVVLTSPQHHDTRAAAIRATWGSQVMPRLLFVTGAADALLPVEVVESYDDDDLAAKELTGWLQIWTKYGERYRWYVKGDDDTYLVVPNVEHMLQQLDPDEPWFLGRRFLHPPDKIVYPSGGAGYILSREALRQVAPMLKKCASQYSKAQYSSSYPGDLALGHCMKSVKNATMPDTRDQAGRERFHPFAPETHYTYDFIAEHKKGQGWYRKYSWYGLNEPGENCCPPTTLSFHYVSPERMVALHKIIYDPEKSLDSRSFYSANRNFGMYKMLRSITENFHKPFDVTNILFTPYECERYCRRKYAALSDLRSACLAGCSISFEGQYNATNSCTDLFDREEMLVTCTESNMRPDDLEEYVPNARKPPKMPLTSTVTSSSET